MGEASCTDKVSEGGFFKGRKDFCLVMSKGTSRPGNTSVRKLLSDDRFTDAVLEFLRNTGV